MHLRFCMNRAYSSSVKCHPQKAIRDLGITYQHSVPQSMSDSWEFWNCENVPTDLPDYLRVVDWDPMERIGWGLSEEAAVAIRDYSPEK